MNYYQRIQQVLDTIEDRLKDTIDIDCLTGKAYMSRASLYRIFYYLLGDTIYGYIKKRRLSEAASELISTDRKIIDIALDYGYNSPEAFSRAFKAYFRKSPSRFRKEGGIAMLKRRINVMNHPDSNTDNHPEVIAVEELGPLTVAACHIIGPDPEINSMSSLMQWAKESRLPYEIGDIRLFGFNNPDRSHPANENKPHGYESWMTIPSGGKETDSVKLKTFAGGLYATMKTTVGKVGQSWQKLVAWLDTSKYSIGEHQWLEEVLALDSENELDIRLKIMMPIESVRRTDMQEENERMESTILELIFTEATEADIPELTEVMTRAFDDDSQKHFGKERGGPPGYDNGDFFRKWLFGYQETVGYKISFKSKIIGGMIVWIYPHGHNILGTIFVDPEYQDREVGKRIWAFVESTYPDTKTWQLETPSLAIKNHYFYEKCGFTKVEVKPNEDDLPGESWVYRKEMAPNKPDSSDAGQRT